MERKSRGGRPPIPDHKKCRHMAIILPPADIELLTKAAEREGVNRSELVRRMMEPELRKLRKDSVYYDDLRQWNERRR